MGIHWFNLGPIKKKLFVVFYEFITYSNEKKIVFLLYLMKVYNLLLSPLHYFIHVRFIVLENLFINSIILFLSFFTWNVRLIIEIDVFFSVLNSKLLTLIIKKKSLQTLYLPLHIYLQYVRCCVVYWMISNENILITLTESVTLQFKGWNTLSLSATKKFLYNVLSQHNANVLLDNRCLNISYFSSSSAQQYDN